MTRFATTIFPGRSGETIQTLPLRTKTPWGLAGLLSLYYFLTSAVVVANAFLWLPTFPEGYYWVQRVLYFPLRPYFDGWLAILGPLHLSYQGYALISRGPILLLGLVLFYLALRRLAFRRHPR